MERSAVSTTAELLVELINDGENGPTVGRTDRHAVCRRGALHNKEVQYVSETAKIHDACSRRWK